MHKVKFIFTCVSIKSFHSHIHSHQVIVISGCTIQDILQYVECLGDVLLLSGNSSVIVKHLQYNMSHCH